MPCSASNIVTLNQIYCQCLTKTYYNLFSRMKLIIFLFRQTVSEMSGEVKLDAVVPPQAVRNLANTNIEQIQGSGLEKEFFLVGSLFFK